MKTSVFTDSSFSMKLIKRLIREEVGSLDLRIVYSAPMSTLYSGVLTRLAVLGEPVALVLDTETTDPAAVTRRRQSAEEVIGDAAARAPFRMLLAVPSLESLLFTRPSLLARAFGDRADDGGRSQELGRLSPRDAYKRLDPEGAEGSAFNKLLQAMEDDNVISLREESPIRELIAFVTEVGSPAATVSSNP